MHATKIITSSILFSLLFGCASMNTPSSSLADEKPIITIGSTSNPPEDHIVFIPANTEFPIVFSVNGDMFNESASSKVMASFKRNMYLYKYRASLDGKIWVNSHKLLNVTPSGGFDASGGKVEVSLELAK